MDNAYVLDSYALLAHLENETRGAEVTNLLKNATWSNDIELYMSVVNLGEDYYITMRERGEEKAEEVLSFIKLLPLHIIEVDLEATIAASKLKSRYSVAYANCFAASLAKQKDVKVITGDPEFKKLEEEIRVEWI